MSGRPQLNTGEALQILIDRAGHGDKRAAELFEDFSEALLVVRYQQRMPQRSAGAALGYLPRASRCRPGVDVVTIPLDHILAVQSRQCINDLLRFDHVSLKTTATTAITVPQG
jgi:uncharacterized protein (UPF0210 family)